MLSRFTGGSRVRQDRVCRAHNGRSTVISTYPSIHRRLRSADTTHSNEHICVRSACPSGCARCWLFGNNIPVSMRTKRDTVMRMRCTRDIFSLQAALKYQSLRRRRQGSARSSLQSSQWGTLKPLQPNPKNQTPNPNPQSPNPKLRSSLQSSQWGTPNPFQRNHPKTPERNCPTQPP